MYITVLCVQAIPIPVQSVVCVGVPFTATYMYTSLFYKKTMECCCKVSNV